MIIAGMKKIATILLSLSATASGCMMAPERADGSFEMAGNYQAIADCALLILRKDGGRMWGKDDLTSQNRAQITYGTYDSIVGTIDFIGVGANRTRIEPHMRNALYVERYRRQFAGC